MARKFNDSTAQWVFSHVAVSTIKTGRGLRRHSPNQLARLVRSIGQFGIPVPIVVDSNYEVIDGHLVLKAARKLGLAEVPVARRDDLSDEQVRALRIALNRLAELSCWDEDALGLELSELGNLNFDLELTGFSTPELDALFLSPVLPGEVIDLPTNDGAPAVSRDGDAWIIGDHIIGCGDARDVLMLNRVLGGELAQMVFTDVPYNMNIDGNAAGIHQSRYREFAMASGEMSSAEYRIFLEQSLGALTQLILPGGIIYVCMDWKHLQPLLEVGELLNFEYKNLCVWAKTNFGMGSFYRSQHELVVVFKAGQGEHIRNIGPGTKGRNRTNLWTYAGVNGFSRGRSEALALHPTVKPLAMVADAIRDCSKRGGIILDPFAGSGTTLTAAHHTGRRGRGIEIDPFYVDTIVRRLERETGEHAIRGDGVTFAEASADAVRGQAA